MINAQRPTEDHPDEPDLTPLSSSAKDARGVLLLTCAATAVAAFVLPLCIPPARVFTVSASYVAGFNNRVAVVGVALISVAVTAWRWQRANESVPAVAQDATHDPRISPRLTAAVILCTCLFFTLSGFLVERSHLRYLADAGYFIEQMSAHAESGRVLYTQLEFAYGPLLFYPTVWVQHLLRGGWVSAYFVTLALDQSAGLLMLAYVLNQLPIRASDRKLALILFAVAAINPLFGLNYTFARFITPYAVLLLSTRVGSIGRMTALLAMGELLQLSISPELGFAFLIAVFCFSALQAVRLGSRWLIVATAPLLGACVFVLTIGRPYLRMLTTFSKGGMSLPVAPYPHILIFLFALVWIVPTAIAIALRQKTLDGTRTVACYALALGLLPATLGRCDPLHVFFNGVGILALSFITIRRASIPARSLWIGALVLFTLWLQIVNNRLYLDRTFDTFRLAVLPSLPERWRSSLTASFLKRDPDSLDRLREAAYQIDVSALERIVGRSSVATPLEVGPNVEAALKRSGHYSYAYFGFFSDVLNDTGEQRDIRDLNTHRWALVPTDWDNWFVETPQNIDGIQGFAFPFRQRNPIPYPLGDAFSANLDDRWTRVREFGPYTLIEHQQPPTAPE